MSHRNLARRGFLGMAAAQVAISQSHGGAAATKMKLAVGADHAGFPMKGPMTQTLQSWGFEIKDCGTFSTDPVDFPDIAQHVCDEILAGRAQRGVLFCGTGVGAAIAANKVRNIRAALCLDTFCAHQCVEHDNVNVLCLGAWVVGPKVAEEILTAFLNAKFQSADADYQRRLRKIAEMEKR